jgi:hypothetical protein
VEEGLLHTAELSCLWDQSLVAVRLQILAWLDFTQVLSQMIEVVFITYSRRNLLCEEVTRASQPLLSFLQNPERSCYHRRCQAVSLGRDVE